MQRVLSRRTFLATVGVASLAGCLGSGQSSTPEDQSGDGDSGSTGPPSAADRLPLPLEPSAVREQAISGGPSKDGIPSIDDPSFVSAGEAPAGLDPGDPVFGVATENEVKAYPQSILVSHEICNDVIDGTPVSVTYCPLTGTAMGFERGDTTFGVSGRLVNNNLIMYDRATETWWPQVLATAIPGPWNESPTIRSLSEFRVVWTSWDRWRTRYPDTKLLSRDTGYARNYNSDLYGSYNPRNGYYAPDQAPMFRSLSDDDRLKPKTVVLGARTPAGAVAFLKDTLRDAKIVESTLGDMPIFAVYEPDLDTGYVYRNPSGDRFEYRDGTVVDPAGESHQPAELPLDSVLAFDAMWFAWSGFYPDTTLHD
jgi:hypothetical protein